MIFDLVDQGAYDVAWDLAERDGMFIPMDDRGVDRWWPWRLFSKSWSGKWGWGGSGVHSGSWSRCISDLQVKWPHVYTRGWSRVL